MQDLPVFVIPIRMGKTRVAVFLERFKTCLR